MKHDVDPLHGLAQRVVIADVDAMKIEIPAYFFEVSFVACEKVIDDGHALRAMSEETPHQRRSDESRTTSYQEATHLFQFDTGKVHAASDAFVGMKERG